MKFRKKPVVIEATKWMRNGDHSAFCQQCKTVVPTTAGVMDTHLDGAGVWQCKGSGKIGKPNAERSGASSRPLWKLVRYYWR